MRLRHLFIIYLTLPLAFASAGTLQETIDNAEAGDVILLPAGIYLGPITLKDGVQLVAEEGQEVIIDGQGAANVVSLGKNNLLKGLTIQNGNNAIRNNGHFTTIAECTLRVYKHNGLFQTRGTALIANSDFIGNKKGTGLFFSESNPMLMGNTIQNNRYGSLISGKLIPVFSGNHIANNHTGIRIQQNAEAAIYETTFTNNIIDIEGEISNQGNTQYTDKRLREKQNRKLPLKTYQDLSNTLYKELIAAHSKVTYDLSAMTAGKFYVTTEHASAIFAVGASTKDTLIQTHEAFDSETEQTLNSTLVTATNTAPRVSVQQPEITDKARDRFVLDTVYAHQASLQKNELGQWIFNRLTNLSRICIKIPAGYIPSNISHAAEITTGDGQLHINITDVGNTQLRIVMDPISNEERL